LSGCRQFAINTAITGTGHMLKSLVRVSSM
jgi:hypothetical protein